MHSYRIEPIEPNAHFFKVSMTIEKTLNNQVISLPNWLPGSYLVRDFSKHIIDLKASSNKKSIQIQQNNKHQFELLIEADKKVEIEYLVYAWDRSVRKAHLDQTHGFFNGSSVFFEVIGQSEKPCKVDIILPNEEPYCSWSVATGMPRQEGQAFKSGSFLCDNYDALIDYPVEMGMLDIFTFDACNTPHYLVLSGRNFADGDRICQDLKKICEAEINLFGGKAPFDEYLFLTTVVEQGYGGLEHRNSTALICSRDSLPNKNQTDINDDYLSFLGLCSHEYFHNWNIKRIKPSVFVPYNLDKESYTTQLWAYEGITSYYDEWLLHRCGLIDAQRYLDVLSKTMTRVLRGDGRLIQSLKDSSFNAWNKFYQQDESAQDTIVSYYTKGAMFALLLDLTMRKVTNHEKNIDDLMTHLWTEFGQKNKGTEEDSHQVIAEQLTGTELSSTFSYLERCDDLPLSHILEEFGIKMSLRAAVSTSDQGGCTKRQPMLDLGMRLKHQASGTKIMSVKRHGLACQAGLSAGDTLLAFDDFKVTKDFSNLLANYKENQTVTVHWFRENQMMQSTITLHPPEKNTVELTIVDASKANKWLTCS